MPWEGLPVHSRTKHYNISNPVRVFSPLGHLFLACTRFGTLYRKAGLEMGAHTRGWRRHDFGDGDVRLEHHNTGVGPL